MRHNIRIYNKAFIIFVVQIWAVNINARSYVLENFSWLKKEHLVTPIFFNFGDLDLSLDKDTKEILRRL
jgi:hypothetical protein